MKEHKIAPFKALADARRRKIIQLLMVSSSLSLHAITANFETSRQAITRHITTLEDAGFLKTKKQGRETIYYLDMEPLKEVMSVVNAYQAFWEEKMNNLDNLVNNQTA